MPNIKKSPTTYLFAAIIFIVFLLSFLYSARRNFRKGVFVDDQFFYLTSGTLLESDEQNKISLKSNDSGIDYTITLDGVTQTANLKWDSGHVTITYENGLVVEGDWNGENMVDHDGKPVTMHSAQNTNDIKEDAQLASFYQNDALNHTLCQISRNKTVKRHSLLTIVLGIAFYMIGALEFLNPDTYRFFLRGWKYKRDNVTEKSALSEKVGGIVVMVIGLLAITGIFIS